MQSKFQRAAIRWGISIASALWIVVTVYQEFIEADPDQYSFKSPEVQSQLQSCGGNFHQRYDCKEAAVLAKQRASFLIWLEKVCVTFGPPLGLFLLVRYSSSRQRVKPTAFGTKRPPPIIKRRTR